MLKKHRNEKATDIKKFMKGYLARKLLKEIRKERFNQHMEYFAQKRIQIQTEAQNSIREAWFAYKVVKK